jgi:hypothetical protein
MESNARGGHSNTGKGIPKLPLAGWVGEGTSVAVSADIGLAWTGIHVRAKFHRQSKQTFFFLSSPLFLP